MDIKRKFFTGAVVKDDSLGDRQIRVIVSTPEEDRVKDVMEPSGCVLDNYSRNPIVLADHNTKAPIGNAEVEVKAERVEAVITFAPAGISAKADEYCGLYKAGVMNTVSPGFKEIEVENRKGGGFRIKKWELLELSCVAVPANAGAVTIARSLDEAARDGANWKVGASRNLPVADGGEWDAAAAGKGIFEKAGFDAEDPHTAFARKGFLIYDAAKPDDQGSYLLAFAKMIDTRLTATKSGLRDAAAKLLEIDIPEDVREKARAVIDHYEGEMNKSGETLVTTKERSFFKTKDLYDISDLASAVQWLVYLAQGAEWEREYEGDSSSLPEMLAAIAHDAGAALIAMTAEEVAEVMARLPGASTEQKAFVGAGKTVTIKALRLGTITKAGRKFSAETRKSMEEACKGILGGHDAICALLADTDSGDEPDPTDDTSETASTDTEKALPAGVLSERERELELLRLTSC